MAIQALKIGGASLHRFSISDHRGFMDHVKAVYMVVILLFTAFCIEISGPCVVDKVQNPLNYDACGPYNENFQVHYGNDLAAGGNPQILPGNSVAQLSLENVCASSNSFCFPSTLPGFLAEAGDVKDSNIQLDDTLSVASPHGKGNSSWASKFGGYKLLNGKVVSCSLDFLGGVHDSSCHQTNSCDQDDIASCRGTLLDQKAPVFENSLKIKSGISDGGSLQVEVSPPLLDWGQKYLYRPSLAFLTVMNTHRDSILNVYEPYSTSSQFYPCNFSEMNLGPGEVASVCFVFLPTNLGVSSAQLILQTSFGGFLIQARGFVNESPYRIEPLIDFDNSSGGRLRKNLSFFNPFEETLYVEEVTAWISFSSGSTSHLAKAICSLSSLEGDAGYSDPSVNKWVGRKVSQVYIPDMAIRPHRKWEVAPHSTEIIIELDFHQSQGKIFGACCMQVLRSSEDKADIIVVPLEAEVGIISTFDGLDNPVSVSLEALLPCDYNGTVIAALSLRNDAPFLLRVVKIIAVGENAQYFQFKYVEGFIIFPGTVTHVAAVTFAPIANQSHDPRPEVPNISMNCKVLIVTNDSSNPQIELPCNDIITICLRHPSDYYVVDNQDHPEDMDISRSQLLKALEMTRADELVLQNWRSQGTGRDMSVLDEHEMLFPMVEIGTYHLQWITVKNPSHLPVVMQLILNSGEIVDECKDPNVLLQPCSFSNLVHDKDMTPTRYGFSIADSAVTEAYVHPYGKATFGPILFHPSRRCWWKSSALVRNNLSGVEWLSLRGFGGSLSLVLFEGSDPVHRIEFNVDLLHPFNFSPPDILDHPNINSSACFQPCLKEFYAKNTGDLVVEVSKIEISGAQCELDGFLVHTCKGFALQPNESKKLVISHRTDFSSAIVQRDLELALPSGILVIPMKACCPMSMLHICRKSLLWMRVKKSLVLVIFAIAVIVLTFSWIFPQVISYVSQNYSFRRGECSIAPLICLGKSSCLHHNNGNNSQFAIPAKVSVFSRLLSKMAESGWGCSDGQCVVTEQRRTAEAVNLSSSYSTQNRCLVHPPKEYTLRSSFLSKSVTLEKLAMQDESQPENLTVKVGKEKGRRRKKKKGTSAGITGQFDVSSSQSGNSTPSSPLSPVSFSTPKRSCSKSPDVVPYYEARNPFANRRCEKTPGTETSSKASILEPICSVKYGSNNLSCCTPAKPSTLRRTATPVLLASATFPSAGKSAPSFNSDSPLLASTSPIAPHARAPGSKLRDRRSVGTQSNKVDEDNFKYDIWGDHLFGLQLMGGSGEVYTKSRFATSDSRFAANSHSDSFFLRGPQPNPQLTFVGSNKEG